MNLIDVNLDMINLVKDLPEDAVVFYFLAGAEEERDFLYAKGQHDMMSEALSNLMTENEDIENIVRNAIVIFQS